MDDTILEIKQITKTFEGIKALKSVEFQVQRGEFLTLLGPSGCGKTTTLRIIAGLETPDSGTVLLDGADVTALEPNKRNVNTVFQSYALFPHMTVAQNIGYGLKLKKVPKEEIQRRVEEMLELVQLSGFGSRMPSQLSGGQRQRVAIARAIINNPSVLLLDEPLGALDLQLRKQMQMELKRLQKKLGITFIYITHDQEEALNMSDRIGIMNGGEIIQLDTPEEIYERPNSRFAAQFIGQTNILETTVQAVEEDGLLLAWGGGSFPIHAQGELGEHLTVCIRTERVHFDAEPVPGFDLRGTITEYFYTGGLLRTTITLQDGAAITVTDTKENGDRLAEGTQVYIHWNIDRAVVVERSADIAQ